MVKYQESSDLFLFVANLHSLTSISDQNNLKALTLQAATDLLALGIDPDRCYFWVQSDVPETAELTWILSCITPMGLMERAHSFKDKVAKKEYHIFGLNPLVMFTDNHFIHLLNRLKRPSTIPDDIEMRKVII